MARKRLTPLSHATGPVTPPALSDVLASGTDGGSSSARRTPPIARVAGESAAEAALATLSDEVAQARAEGRLIVSLALGEIDESHLVRDRVGVDETEMTVLMTSLTERGQQTAIEVIDFGDGHSGPRYGLISGWRRLLALRRLHKASGEDRFATVKALVRHPETAPEAYRAMVDENEIRVGLSYWERARIAVQAADAGIYPTAQHALRDLFSAASRAKRSKIGSFIGLYAVFGEDGLFFPTALSERSGLQLAKALDTHGEKLAARIRKDLAATAPETPAEEQDLLACLLKASSKPETPRSKEAQKTGPQSEAQKSGPAGDVQLRRIGPDRLELFGPGVDSQMEAKLITWLQTSSRSKN